MKKIVLVGLVVNHHSLYQQLLNTLIKEFTGITFITKDEIFNQISLTTKNVNVIIDNSRLDLVYKNNISLINEHNILISDEYFGSFARIRDIQFLNEKRLFITHNANKWVKKAKTSFLNPKLFIDQLFKSHFEKQIDVFITLGPNIEKFMRSHLNKKTDVFWTPFDVVNGIKDNHVKRKSDDIIILIPGSISNLRRNYKDLLWVINQYYEKHNNSRIKFSFLGRIIQEKDSFVAVQCKNINKIYKNKIKYWENFIDESIFEKEVQSADFILSNIYPVTINKGITEIYGITKESGISYVLYKYSKPGIVPSFQKVLEGFDSQLIRFDEYSNLITLFEKIEKGLINSKNLSREALTNTERFNALIEKETKKLIGYLKG